MKGVSLRLRRPENVMRQRLAAVLFPSREQRHRTVHHNHSREPPSAPPTNPLDSGYLGSLPWPVSLPAYLLEVKRIFFDFSATRGFSWKCVSQREVRWDHSRSEVGARGPHDSAR